MSTRESTDHQQDDLESISNLSHTTGSTLQPLPLDPNKAVKILEGFPDTLDKRALYDFSGLLDSVPPVAEHFEIVEKIGEGTFSSVYLAHIKGFPEQHYALKHLVPTSSPSRIENEIKCLQLLQGKENVVSLLTMLRHYDQVVLVMPYFMHDKFTDYLPSMTVVEARDYMSALFSALANVHSHHIIHRDIKPSNFLYNRERKKFQLVDFGLAQFEIGWEEQSFSQKLKQRNNLSRAERKERPLSNGTTLVPPHTYQRQLQHKMAAKSHKHIAPETAKAPVLQTRGDECALLHGQSEVCDHCMERANQVAPRAGTPGFRAPEVLFKCPKQTTAVDIWSAGVILLCLLSGKYPFFKAHDDLTALAQLIGLLGSKRCAEAAEACGKELSTSPEIPPCNMRTLCQSLRASLVNKDLCDTRPASSIDTRPPVVAPVLSDDNHMTCSKRLKLGVDDTPTKVNSYAPIVTQKCLMVDGHNCHGSSTAYPVQDGRSIAVTSWGEVPQSMYDLLHRCLDLDPSTRITASEALKHPFITDKLG